MELSKRTGLGFKTNETLRFMFLQRKRPESSLSPSSLARPSHREPCMTPDSDPKERGSVQQQRRNGKKFQEANSHVLHFDKAYRLYINYKPMKFKKPREELEANCRGTSKSNCHIPVSTWLAFQIKLKCW